MLLKIKDDYIFCILTYPKISWVTIVRKKDYKSAPTANFMILLYKTFERTGHEDYVCFINNKIAYFNYAGHNHYVEIVK